MDCWTDPPCVTLTIRDDGQGIKGRRDDSYGISIMRERAERIDASLEVTSASDRDSTRGTTVRVNIQGKSILSNEGRRSYG